MRRSRGGVGDAAETKTQVHKEPGTHTYERGWARKPDAKGGPAQNEGSDEQVKGGLADAGCTAVKRGDEEQSCASGARRCTQVACEQKAIMMSVAGQQQQCVQVDGEEEP